MMLHIYWQSYGQTPQEPRDDFLCSPRDVDRGVEGPLDEAAKFALGDGCQGVEHL